MRRHRQPPASDDTRLFFAHEHVGPGSSVDLTRLFALGVSKRGHQLTAAWMSKRLKKERQRVSPVCLGTVHTTRTLYTLPRHTTMYTVLRIA